MGLLRRIFGLNRKLPQRTAQKDFASEYGELYDSMAEGTFLKSRYSRMGNFRGNDHLELQLDDIRHVLKSAIQDIAVMQSMLQEQGLWDDDLYKKLRVERMIGDHSAVGADPWGGHSVYQYTLEESEFLSNVFDASEDEVKKFESEVVRVSSELT